MAKKWEEIEEMMTKYNYHNCTSEYFNCQFHRCVGSTVGDKNRKGGMPTETKQQQEDDGAQCLSEQQHPTIHKPKQTIILTAPSIRKIHMVIIKIHQVLVVIISPS